MTQMTVQQALELAIRHHQSGNLREAEGIYRQVLAATPGNPDALHLLGLIDLQNGRLDAAHESIGRAVRVNPAVAGYHGNLGQVLAAKGKYDEAIAAYREALRLQPVFPEVSNNLGGALQQLGRADEAVAEYQKVIRLRPDWSLPHYNLALTLIANNRLEEAINALNRATKLQPSYPNVWNDLANALRMNGRLEESIAAYRQAIALRPSFVDGYTNLSDALRETGQLDAAIEACRVALSLQPHSFPAYNHLGNALRDKKLIAESIAAYERALSFQPESFEAHTNLGTSLRMIGRLEESIRHYQIALERRPGFADAHNGLGVAFQETGQLDESAAEYRKAIASRPNWVLAQYNLSHVMLLKGDFEQGWAGYENRLKVRDLTSHLDVPGERWAGEALEGRTILLHAEQGMGDTIQFVRYVPMVKDKGGRVILMCHPELKRLLQSAQGVDELIALSDQPPRFDVHCPLLSLPLAFKTTLETIPAKGPYLKAPPESVVKWKEQIAGMSGLKAGLVWAGRKRHTNDRNRSIAPELFSPLAEIEHINLISLQKEKDRSPAGMTDWTNELGDFAETAGLIQNLDLVITVDTAIAHLAGALGKPVWVLLPFVPDWRWMLDREDSPWYPTMKLFRQKKLNDWDGVIKRIGESLKELI